MRHLPACAVSCSIAVAIIAVAAFPARAGEPTALESATAALGPAPPSAEARDAPSSPETSGELTLAWQSRTLTDWWWVDTGPHGRHTSAVRAAVEVEHEFSESWALWFQADTMFDTHDARWSSSWEDSIVLIAAGRVDLGDDVELEIGARYDDWMELHATTGDPWAFYAQLSFTVEAFGGEVSPYLYHEIRRFFGGAAHDGTWTTDLGAEFEAKLSDDWTLGVTPFVGRLDGSRTDPDVWALGGRAGVAYALTESVSAGVFTEITRRSGQVPDRTLVALGFELTWEF